MSDFKKLFKITWKRFGLWIVLLSLLIAMINSLSIRGEVKNHEATLRHAVETMAKDTNISIDTNKLDKDFFDEADKVAKAYVDKYEIEAWEAIYPEEEAEYEKYYKAKEKKYGKDFYLKEEHISRYADIRNLLKAERFEVYDTWEEFPESYAVRYTKNTLPAVCIFVLLLSVLVTSLEQSLPYYDFTMMYPWKKRDEVWMKSLLVLIFGLIILAINMGVGAIALKSSALGSAISFQGVASQLGQNILLLTATSILSVATGMIAGNFVGHLGILIIASAGFPIIRYIIEIFLGIFSGNVANQFGNRMNDFGFGLRGFAKPFYSILTAYNNYQEIVGFLVVAIIWAAIAYVINKNISSEKSGYLVISSPMEIIAKILATLSLASLLYLIIGSAVSGTGLVLLNILAYALSLLISYKLFDILFKVRLKF